MELLRQTWLNLRANRTRSFLTMFGIAWGLVCLILMNALGEGMWIAQKQKARTLGQNIMIVWGGTTSKGHEGIRAGKVVSLTLDDYFMLKEQATHLRRSSPELQRYLTARSAINNGTFSTAGVFPDYMQMRTIEVGPGSRQITDGDNDRAMRVCILGDEVKEQLFNKASSVGKTIWIGDFPYLIIGELEHKDQNSNYSGPDSNKIFVPYYSLVRDFPLPKAPEGKYQISNLILQTRDPELGEAAEM